MNNWFRVLVFSAAILVTISACGILGGEEKLKELLPPEKELVPLEVGNYWVYEQWLLDPTWKDTVREEVLSVRDIVAENTKIRAYGSYRFHYKDEPREDARISLKANGAEGHYYLGGRTESDSLYVKDLRYKYPAEPGDTWEATQTLYTPSTGQYSMGTTRTIELVDTTKTVETPAGIFENCYVFKHPDFNDLIVEDVYIFIKPGIGIVGGESRGSLDTTTVIGQWMLLEYKLD